MKTFKQALLDGFYAIIHQGVVRVVIPPGTMKEEVFKDPDMYSFKFGDNKEYELCFERLIWDEQWYVAVYKNQELLTEKVVVKPGYKKGARDTER